MIVRTVQPPLRPLVKKVRGNSHSERFGKQAVLNDGTFSVNKTPETLHKKCIAKADRLMAPGETYRFYKRDACDFLDRNFTFPKAQSQFECFLELISRCSSELAA